MAHKDSEKRKAYRKEYWEANKEKMAAWNKEYKEKNKEKIAVKRKEYSQTIKGKYGTYEQSAKTRGYDFSLTEDEFATFWQKPCFYCGDPIDTIGLDRIDNNIGYQLDNLVSCCTICNLAKRDLSQEEFKNHIKKLYFNLYN